MKVVDVNQEFIINKLFRWYPAKSKKTFGDITDFYSLTILPYKNGEVVLPAERKEMAIGKKQINSRKPELHKYFKVGDVIRLNSKKIIFIWNSK